MAGSHNPQQGATTNEKSDEDIVTKETKEDIQANEDRCNHLT
jgi:hypothetical protein